MPCLYAYFQNGIFLNIILTDLDDFYYPDHFYDKISIFKQITIFTNINVVAYIALPGPAGIAVSICAPFFEY